jgi:hypothetical protein
MINLWILNPARGLAEKRYRQLHCAHILNYYEKNIDYYNYNFIK